MKYEVVHDRDAIQTLFQEEIRRVEAKLSEEGRLEIVYEYSNHISNIRQYKC